MFASVSQYAPACASVSQLACWPVVCNVPFVIEFFVAHLLPGIREWLESKPSIRIVLAPIERHPIVAANLNRALLNSKKKLR